jgi:transposase
MAYRRMEPEKLYEILRRRRDGQHVSEIARQTEVDRKTVREYLRQFDAAGWLGPASPTRESFLAAFATLQIQRDRSRPASGRLTPYIDEIRALVSGPEPVKPKTAYRIIKRKYNLNVSYATFKRFYRTHGIRPPARSIIRIELPPGKELQMDYGQVGRWLDPLTGRQRVVYAFCGVLAHCRLPFVQFVFTQDGVSFAQSFVAMFEYYGGAPLTVTIDNLKSGVLKPDLYEPEINPAFAELCDYYGVFVNTARVRRPTDKGKIERFVPVARELFRELKALSPNVTLDDLNRAATQWCRDTYGQHKHGTTGEKPYEIFQHREQPALRALPPVRFSVPLWKPAKVHPDQFIQFEGRFYSLPPQFIGRTVMVKKTGKIAHIFANRVLVRSYPLTGQRRSYVKADFPDGVRDMLAGDYPRLLLRKAKALGPATHAYIEETLSPHAYLNSRRAHGLLTVLEKFRDTPDYIDLVRTAHARKIVHPRVLRTLLETRTVTRPELEIIPRSPAGNQMLRDASYYFTDAIQTGGKY